MGFDGLRFNIYWHFNPPPPPSHCEPSRWCLRACYSKKGTVRKVHYTISHDRVLNDEALLSFVAEVEHVVRNNRPSTPISSNAADDSPLTPKMLLIGRLHSDAHPG